MNKPVFLKTKEVADLLGCRPRVLQGWVRKGTFPAPVVVSRRTHLWPAAVIERWIQEKSQ